MPHSLRCPQCDGAVSVSDRDAGSRVKCPHCESTFVAPGSSVAANDDDDWLRLDDDPSSGEAATAEPVTDEPQSLDELTDTGAFADIDEFTGVEEPLPSGAPVNESSDEPGFGSVSGEDDLFGDLPPMESPTLAPPPNLSVPGSSSSSMPGLGPPTNRPPTNRPPTNRPPAGKPAPAAGSVEYESEFRLNCHVCGSMMYVKAAQQGKTIKCGDCHSQVLVPAPPKVRQKPTIDIENAETFQFEEAPQNNRREDPFRKSAVDLLQDAEQAEPDKKEDDFATPDIMEWARKVFGIFTDLNVMIRWIMISVLGSVPAYFALLIDSNIVTLGLFVGGTLFAALLIACGFAILTSVANDEPTVEEWPSMDPLEWFGNAWVAFAAAGFAGVPALALSQFVFDNTLIIVAVTMFSVYMLFPFVLLSMLDMQTVTMPFSPEVARSVTSSQESWGGFYFSAGLLFFGLFLVFVATSGMSPSAAAMINVTATVGLVFTYFAMIGRLAFAIGQSVNEPARKNDEEKEQSQTQEPS